MKACDGHSLQFVCPICGLDTAAMDGPGPVMATVAGLGPFEAAITCPGLVTADVGSPPRSCHN